jgi:hypothetical protein
MNEEDLESYLAEKREWLRDAGIQVLDVKIVNDIELGADATPEGSYLPKLEERHVYVLEFAYETKEGSEGQRGYSAEFLDGDLNSVLPFPFVSFRWPSQELAIWELCLVLHWSGHGALAENLINVDYPYSSEAFETAQDSIKPQTLQHYRLLQIRAYLDSDSFSIHKAIRIPQDVTVDEVDAALDLLEAKGQILDVRSFAWAGTDDDKLRIECKSALVIPNPEAKGKIDVCEWTFGYMIYEVQTDDDEELLLPVLGGWGSKTPADAFCKASEFLAELGHEEAAETLEAMFEEI